MAGVYADDGSLAVTVVSGTITSTPSATTIGVKLMDPTTDLALDPALPANVRSAPATAVLSSVAGSASSVTLKASNTARTRLYIVNESSAILYVAYASSATTTAYTWQVPATTATGPYTLVIDDGYNGIVTGIWASATGNARVTELTYS